MAASPWEVGMAAAKTPVGGGSVAVQVALSTIDVSFNLSGYGFNNIASFTRVNRDMCITLINSTRCVHS